MITELASIAHILLNASPIIASAFGSPVAGIAMSLVSHAFGTSGKPEELVQKVMADVPGATFILQDLEAKHGDIIEKIMNGMNQLDSCEINIKLHWNQSNSQG